MRIIDCSAHVYSSDLAFADRVAAERHIAATLRRRGTAEGRIGVPYRPIGARGESRISPASRHAVAQLLTISSAPAIARPPRSRIMSAKHCRLVTLSHHMVFGVFLPACWPFRPASC